MAKHISISPTTGFIVAIKLLSTKESARVYIKIRMPCETSRHGINSDKANFVKQRHVKNFILKRLSEVSFTIFVFLFFVLCCRTQISPYLRSCMLAIR